MKGSYSSLNSSLGFSLVAALVASAIANPTQAEETSASVDDNIEKLAVVGTRAAPRSVSDSPVPLDIIDADEFVRQGATDLKSILSSLSPSFNVNDQPINDAATMVRPANLRGLAPDHTLVLVNGKRRHRSAVITFLGGGLSDGSQGPDISNIPISAIKQVEILRDGAAAQYGSDAIAGVINFVLKDADEGGMIEARWGQYYEGDGATPQITGNIGFNLSENGFANFSAEYRQADDTSRSVQRADAQGLVDAGNTEVNDPAQIWGSPKIDADVKLLGNFGLDLNQTDHAYLWLNYARREVDGGFYFRNPHTRGGVFQGPEVNGQATLLVADLTPDDGIACPVIYTGDNVLESAGYQQLLDDPNCFAFNEIDRLRGGFTPRFGGKVTDLAMVMGLEGEWANEWAYDLSANWGKSSVDYSIYNTINPSLGPNTPFEFEPGSYHQIEQTYNFDLSKPLEIEGWDEPLYFAAGLEYRRETFEIDAGDVASFAVGDLASQGFGIGSNGFPGFKPEDAGSWSRYNYAAYLDIETYLSEDWLVTAAVRYEDFSDFGSTFNGKLSTHVQLNEVWGIRAAASTGFRAPTVGQSNVRNVTTAFTENGLEDQATLPPTNPISVQKGGTPLEPEESVNLSTGLVAQFDSGLNITVDYFHITLEDRISQTSPLDLSADDIQALLAQGINDATSFSSVKYFTNDFDTTTQGIDLIASYGVDLSNSALKFTLAYNWTDTKVDDYNPNNINEAKVMVLEDNLPAHRGSLSADWQFEQVALLTRLNYYGEYFEDHLDAGGDLPIDAGAEITVDLEGTYYFNDHWSASLGAQNLLDNHPDVNPWRYEVGSLYPTTSPMGINGGFYYLRANYVF